MPFQRPIFGTLTSLFCISLGVFSLLQNRKSKLNRHFAFFNFTNALWNFGEYAIFFENHSWGLWVVRLAGIGSCLVIPFLLDFVYELIGISETKNAKLTIKVGYILAWTFVGLHLTPLIYRDVNYVPFESSLNVEVPGPLYPLLALFILSELGLIVFSLVKVFRSSSGIRRQYAAYSILACFFGALALLIYFLSYVSIDLPSLYYLGQCLVSFTFAYAIFKHNLINVGIALRRASLLIGIYVVIGFISVPAVILSYNHIVAHGALGLSYLIFILFFAGFLFSLGPIFYSKMIQRSTLFQDETTSHITHEFKTPLHAIQSAKAILEDELSSERPDQTKIHDYMEMIQRNTDRLEKFVVDILAFNKAGGTEEGDQQEPVDLVQLCRSTLDSFPDLASRVSFNSVGPIVIKGHQEGLRQIFSNLISNAGKFSSDGKITVQMKPLSDHVEISVADQGIGIEKKDLKKIFEPFVQSQEGQKQKKGSGLGLAIAQKWVQAHNGKIWVESDGLGKGSRVIFVVPF